MRKDMGRGEGKEAREECGKEVRHRKKKENQNLVQEK